MARVTELEKQVRPEEEWFNSWRASKACETFANEIGAEAQKMGEDDALKRMKKALAGSHPDLSWDSVVSSYQALAKAEDAALLAELNIGLSEEESDDA